MVLCRIDLDEKVENINMYKIMPFENTLAIMTLTGQQIFNLIHTNYKGRVSRLQGSKHLKIRFKIDDQDRVISTHITVNDQPLDLKKTYRVAMNSYMSGGGSCCQFLKALPQKDTGISLLLSHTTKQPRKNVPTHDFLKLFLGVQKC